MVLQVWGLGLEFGIRVRGPGIWVRAKFMVRVRVGVGVSVTVRASIMVTVRARVGISVEYRAWVEIAVWVWARVSFRVSTLGVFLARHVSILRISEAKNSRLSMAWMICSVVRAMPSWLRGVGG